ncbi:maleylpyruvate isomerase family mycothiol-dependent enzyme [Nocardia aurea]|uniref:maleylpyruvate isomerase family mycothiol-dependent enzyme n=1 Tax=Nocardia aurea TaxID=2144174 RepID=UPI0033BC9B98
MRISTTAAARRAALVAETDALAGLLREADPATPIPACPGWSLADLVTHVGRAQRWAAAMIGERATEQLDMRAVPEGKRPAEPEAAARWLQQGARLLLAAVDTTGPEVEVWTTLGVPRPARWWIRRLTNEIAVHHADAVLALGRSPAMDPGLAADAVEEWLELLTAAPTGRAAGALPAGGALHLHATDLSAGGEWTVRASTPSITWDREHATTTVTARGSATAVLLLLMGRLHPGHPGLEIDGDTGVLTRWIEHTPF